MVRLSRVLLLLLPLLCFHMASAEESISVQLVQTETYSPVEGIITIIHEASKKIDPASFSLDDKPLVVEFIEEKETPKPKHLSSTYRFSLDPQPKGLNLLPPIKVTIGDKTHSSNALAYEVHDSVSNTSSALRLETRVVPASGIFPGQRFKVTYRILYRGNIDLSLEQLPLLDAEGFQKIGQKDIKDSIEFNMRVQTISQEFKALEAGKFSFPTSVIEGLSYDESGGKKNYHDLKLRSETPPISITVDPFPDSERPASFDGAIGQFAITTSLLSSEAINVGDEIHLVIEISGSGEIDTVALPNIRCQPGYSGFFELDELATTEEKSTISKKYDVTLRPLSTALQEVPSIEFSSFMPKEGKYITVKTQAIPITIKKAKEMPLNDEASDHTVVNLETDKTNWLPLWQEPIKSELIEAPELSSRDLQSSPFSLDKVMWILASALVLLATQWLLKKLLLFLQKSTPKSRMYLEKASLNPTSSEFFSFVELALIHRLYEKKWVNSPNIGFEELPETGVSKGIKDFISQVNQKRFAERKEVSRANVLLEAKKLYGQL